MASKLEMVVRRSIVVVAVLLAIGIAVLVHGRTAASTQARDASFFVNATAIKGAFSKALGPHPPVVQLVVEPEECTAQVVVGSADSQHFTFRQSTGYVVAGKADTFPERDDIAFSMSTVPFAAIPALIADGSRALDTAPARLVIDRVPAAKELRYRVFAHDGKVAEVFVKTPDP